jgi:hypothetical protein
MQDGSQDRWRYACRRIFSLADTEKSRGSSGSLREGGQKAFGPHTLLYGASSPDSTKQKAY